ncbi:UDP-N-acetylmuramate dehydrogenase [Pseudodesulfovibrio cashew]|uniref:UDP-N-acetylenolpyruvoylglucosamine reductase n=1 Tax=Pseudodesulfovibrio cashew TaxID=2678688 RepID=A0A6I6JI12_9BACT|nr:UDP-N-acetylmuramate dehydrogenase [Pseudodesulfovibrio cashew]QGY40113.1 UDP-N-acetylmuramate dehydrogenase [Pseudodesulfovibrio cashew]
MALELISNPSLAERTTLGVGGSAEVEIVVRDAADLDDLSEFLTTRTLRPFAIGEGSNILAQDGSLDLALIRTETTPGPERVEKRDNKLIVRCGAAQRLPGLLGWAQMAGLSGLEGLTGIPGSVGGGVAMNAGSYGTEIGDVISRIRIWTPSGGLVWVDAKECEFEYRRFSCPTVPGKALIWEAEFALTEESPKAVRAAMKEIYDKKKATQPVTARSAGCVFKNPEGESAGKLLDEAGMKGATVGNMAFSDVHANFMINLGEGKATEALELLEMGRNAVREQFGITLKTEVIIL